MRPFAAPHSRSIRHRRKVDGAIAPPSEPEKGTRGATRCVSRTCVDRLFTSSLPAVYHRLSESFKRVRTWTFGYPRLSPPMPV